MDKKMVIKAFSFAILFVVSAQLSCNIKTSSKEKKILEDERKQKIIQRNNKGLIVKTYDGYVYRVFDEQGRLVELYGNRKLVDNNTNFRTTIEISDSIVTAKEYFFENDNLACTIGDSLDYHIARYFYSKRKLIRAEYYNPVKDNTGKVQDHKLVEIDENPRINSFIIYLPNYLK